MPILQIYFPEQKEINELKKHAEKYGFKSAAEYVRSLYHEDIKDEFHRWGKK